MRKKRQVIVSKNPTPALDILWKWLQDDQVERSVVAPHEATSQHIFANSGADVVVFDSHLSSLQIQQLTQFCQQARPFFGRMVTIFYPGLPEQLLSPTESPESGVTESDLSQRELEVLSYVARGWTNTEIAGALSVSKNTVGFHLRNIFEKLNVTNRTEAAVWYFGSRSSLT